MKQGKERNYNGAVVCFQKFTIGQNVQFRTPSIVAGSEMHIPGSPACLGYFNRVDVKTVRDFRRYVSVTSKHEAEYPCSRKQLLLRGIKKLEYLDEVLLINSEDAENSLPFRSRDGKSYALCCFSVFSVSGEHPKTHGNIKKQKDFYSGLAEELYDLLHKVREENHYDCQFAFLELLGAEDLCLIVLSNQYQAISDAIEMLQNFNFKNSSNNIFYQRCRVDNVHSILMMDRNNPKALDHVDWSGAEAEMHFSLQSAPGMSYLRKQEKLLRAFLEQTYRVQNRAVSEADLRAQIRVESCSGEYDAILRCPARMLPVVLGLPEKGNVQGCFHPDNTTYQRMVYQSDTYIYPFGLNNDPTTESEESQDEVEDQITSGAFCGTLIEANEYKIFIEQAMKRLKKAFDVEDADNAFDFQELPIWRLLKEFWSFASFPLSEDLREDLEYQFKVAINAIVREAELSTENDGKRSDFMDKYQQIVKALDDSMQAASQQDRWYFGEQQSYIENVESYYKILRCYYGMLKDMITLIYRIPRTSGTNQPYLIPMLSFGVNPLIQSNAFDSYIDHHVDPSLPEGTEYERDAKIISIKLPYQALSNPLKYLGILAHEIFHYASPADRANRNELMCCGLIRVAISEFIDILAENSELGKEMDVWTTLCDNDEAFREIINIAVDNAFLDISEKHNVNLIRLRHIRKMVWDGELRFTVDRTATQGFECYFMIWGSIRAMLLNMLHPDPSRRHPDLVNLKPLCSSYLPLYTEMFALDISVSPGNTQDENLENLRNLYESRIRKTSHDQTNEARRLLQTTYLAMVECPPDIFDLEVVMHRMTPDAKIRQFFWQQYSAKRDLLTPKTIRRDDQSKPLLKNDIRSAIVVSHYLHEQYGQDHPSILKQVLDKWGQSSFKPYYGNARNEFVRNYELVYHRFSHLIRENREICEHLAERIRKQSDDHLKNDLTRFYFSYYNELSNYQDSQGQEADQNVRFDAVFIKTCELIDTYQNQEHFVVRGLTSADEQVVGKMQPIPPRPQSDPRFECEFIAYNNSDLLYKLSLAYEKMMVNGKMPMLWYRGQKQFDWRTLPNMMRLERLFKEEPSYEGFAQTLFYEMQLAQAHILPNGEHLSDAEWIAFLQHYEFKTNALDFSESLAPALYFATEEWVDDKSKRPETDAVIMAFNPVLFNLVMELFEREEQLADLHTAGEMAEAYAENLDRILEDLEKAKACLMTAKKDPAQANQIEKLEKEYDRYHTSLRELIRLKRMSRQGNKTLTQLLEDKKVLLQNAVRRSKENLKRYFETGINYEQPPLFTGTTALMDTCYRYLYDPKQADEFDSCLHPRAVMVPRHCDRMDKQRGEFVYFNLTAEKAPADQTTQKDGTKRVYDYSRWSLEALHEKYVERCRQELEEYEKSIGSPSKAAFVPFLCRIKINRYRHSGFKRYVHAMGMQRFSVYPEYDKLADDLADQLNLN